MINSISDVVKNNMCISCGACVAFSQAEQTQVVMAESKSRGIYIPIVEVGDGKRWGQGQELKVCPGKGYDIKSIGESLFPGAPNEEVELGRWTEAFVARTTSDEILRRASSGGVMTGIAEYLLSHGVVDGVIVTKIQYSEKGPRPQSFIATSVKDLIESQGSKYCPVPVFGDVRDILSFKGKLLFIGTPCQIAALRLAQKEIPHLSEKVPLTVGNFCGGYRDLRETDKIIERAGISASNVKYFQYRGDGQPGSMVVHSHDKNVKLAYPGYARMTGVIKYQRCRLCVDATAELADFACGDAWIPELLQSGKAWSIVLARSKLASNILVSMQAEGLVELEPTSSEVIKLSQKGNLETKKHRQACRIRLFRILGISVPNFDGGYYADSSGLLFELKVHFSHSFFSFLERLGLYKIFAKIIGRYPKRLS